MSDHKTPVTNYEMPTFITAVTAIVWKDLRIEKHTRQTLSVMVMYSLVTVVMFNFALEANLAAAREVATGLLWATILLAGTLGLHRALAIERENQTIDALLIAPIDRHVLYVAKIISVSLFTFLLEIILIFMFIIFFNKPFWQPQVVFILMLGTLGYVAAGVAITSMTIQTRAREVLLPILLFPVILPLILPAAIAIAEFMSGQPEMAIVRGTVSLVLAYDLLVISVGYWVYPYIVEV